MRWLFRAYRASTDCVCCRRETYGFLSLHPDSEELDWSRTQVAGSRIRQVACDWIQHRPQQHTVLKNTKQISFFQLFSFQELYFGLNLITYFIYPFRQVIRNRI